MLNGFHSLCSWTLDVIIACVHLYVFYISVGQTSILREHFYKQTFAIKWVPTFIQLTLEQYILILKNCTPPPWAPHSSPQLWKTSALPQARPVLQTPSKTPPTIHLHSLKAHPTDPCSPGLHILGQNLGRRPAFLEAMLVLGTPGKTSPTAS